MSGSNHPSPSKMPPYLRRNGASPSDVMYLRLTFFFTKYWESIQDARLSYKNIINVDLLKDRRVAEVVDVGIIGDEHT